MIMTRVLMMGIEAAEEEGEEIADGRGKRLLLC